MKRKAAISFMLTLLMVASTISIVGSKGINNTLCPGAIDFNKEVWNDNYWDETLFAEVGDTVTFRINLTYYRDLTNPDTYRLKDIKIKDELPDCLEFANLDNIYTSEGQTVSYTQEFSGKMIYWNLTANQPELDDNESLYIIFNAYVIESEELQNQNIAYVDAMEDIWHPHTADDDAWVYILEQGDSIFEKKVMINGEWGDEGVGIVDEDMEFKLIFEYLGGEDIYDARFKDELPCVLEFLDIGTVSSTINISFEVSDDGKTLWFNMSEDVIVNEQVVEIFFKALVIGETGNTCPVKNKAWVDIYDPPGQIIESYYDDVLVTTYENHKPCPPIISGPEEGNAGEEITFQIRGYDPDEDDIYYYIDWGEETENDWIGPYASGSIVDVTHSWEVEGEYSIVAKAKDIHDEEGPWGNEITIDISEEQQEGELEVSIRIWLRWFVKVDIENNGETPINDIIWNISVWNRMNTKRFVRKNGTIESLDAGATIMKQACPFGFRFITVSVNVNSPDLNEPIHRHAKGIVFGRFVFLRPFKFFKG